MKQRCELSLAPRCLGVWILLAAALGPVAVIAAEAPAIPRPRLQIINGSSQAIDLFWLKSESKRVPNGSVAPGKDTIITTSLGHRFAVVGRADQSETYVTSEVPVQAFRFEPADKDGVPAFYSQRVSAHGFPIVASARVNPYALKEAAYLVDMMLAKRPDVREAMIKSGARMCIMAHDEFTTDLPEFTRMAAGKMKDFPGVTAKDYWDARARGLGGSETDPLCSVAEENVLAYPGDPYAAECILIHEFAHNIHLRGLVNVDPTFDKRLKRAYDAAMQTGLWKGKYASVNHHEYFAEGVQSWFDNNRVNDHDHNHVHLRSQLVEYDPGLAALCREVFGETQLKYAKPTTRLTGHMDGYDPATAPKFVWPERLLQAKAEIRKAAEGRDQAARKEGKQEPPALPTAHTTRELEGWKVRVDDRLLQGAGAELGERALKLLTARLVAITTVVPEPALAKLRAITIQLDQDYGELRAMQYHPSAGWLQGKGYSERLAKCAHIPNAEGFLSPFENHRMPWVVLHELAHGFHDQTIGFDDSRVIAVWKKFRENESYKSVLTSPGHLREHYGRTDQKEFFAEMTEAYFGSNDFYPFVAGELKQAEPATFKLLEEIWGPLPGRSLSKPLPKP